MTPQLNLLKHSKKPQINFSFKSALCKNIMQTIHHDKQRTTCMFDSNIDTVNAYRCRFGTSKEYVCSDEVMGCAYRVAQIKIWLAQYTWWSKHNERHSKDVSAL